MSRRSTLVAVLLLLAIPTAAATAANAPADAIARARELVSAGSYEVALATLRDSLEEHPRDPDLLVELGRTAYAQALEIFRSTSPTLGRLALFDSMKWYEQATEAKPDLLDAWRGLGAAAIMAGDFDRAIGAWRRAVEIDPNDGESWYRLGYSLAYRGRFEESLPAFESARRLLGPAPRILLNEGISLASLGRRNEAQAFFLDLIRAEAAAGRTSSADMQSGLKRLWKIHSDRSDWAGAEAAFATMAKELPKLAGGWWYLAHARLNAGKAGAAAKAFAKVTELQPDWPDGWSRLGDAYLAAGAPDAAAEALDRLAALDRGGPASSDLLLATIRALVGADRTPDALALLDRFTADFPDDPVILQRRGDLLFRLGRYADALLTWRAAAGLDPFGHEVVVKQEKAATALLRTGDIPGELVPRGPREETPERPAGEGETIFDFEGSTVFARVNGAATGNRTGDGFRLVRKPGAEGMGNLSLTFIPTMDTRPFVSLRFRVRGPAGRALLVLAKDGFDQFEVAPGFVRLTHGTPVELTGETQVVTLPLDGFVATAPNRQIPMNRARLRALIFEIGQVPPGADGDVTLAEEVLFGPVELVREDGSAFTAEDFAGAPSETLFLATGAATAFARTLFTADQIAGFRPDPNTWVTPAIFGEDYDRADVHDGEGSFRLTLPGPGEAAGSLEFNPDRSFDDATAITFWAKGRLGGEKLRVTLTDSLDADIGNDDPASAPRLETPAHLLGGHFVLTPGWKRYTIDRADFPDVDFRSLLKITFEFGTPEGNPVGTTIYLDSIATQ